MHYHVNEDVCIGCGLCTTRCEFDAIHLQRDMPEASRMYRTEDKMKAILPHMIKRAAKITIKDIKEKCAGGTYPCMNSEPCSMSFARSSRSSRKTT